MTLQRLGDVPFWRAVDKHPGTALIGSDGHPISYARLVDEADTVARSFLDFGRRQLAFLLFQHTPAAIAAYLACLRSQAVAPVLLQADTPPSLITGLTAHYEPDWLIGVTDQEPQAGYQDVSLPGGLRARRRIEAHDLPLHDDLALLVTTSGSTGSQKLVRLSHAGLAANARAIAAYLGLNAGERAITTAPLAYSFGMSVLNSHLQVGGAVVLNTESVLRRGFWECMETQQVSSLAGVPSTWDMLERVGINERVLPHLRTLTQAGGRMADATTRRLQQIHAARGRQLFVMYGQAEASPRISFVPPERLAQKIGSIGIAVPGGTLRLADDGELIYAGANVMMGYANQRSDLALGDLQLGVLDTGDLASVDEDGFHYITGRKKRFIKLGGVRTNLDELELALSRATGQVVYCVGEDERLFVLPVGAAAPDVAQVQSLLRQHYRLGPGMAQVRALAQAPLLANGKVDYRSLRDLLESSP